MEFRCGVEVMASLWWGSCASLRQNLVDFKTDCRGVVVMIKDQQGPRPLPDTHCSEDLASIGNVQVGRLVHHSNYCGLLKLIQIQLQ